MKTSIETRPKVTVAMLPLLLLLTLPAAVQAQFNYATINGTITITGYTGPGGAVSIPSTIIGQPVTSIRDRVFVNRTSLTGITIPNSVTNIGDYAFSGCTNLTSITIPKSVTAIGEGALVRCTSLTAITVDVLNSAFSDLDGVLFNKSQTELIQYPGGKAGSYTAPNSVIRIEDLAFQFCAGLTSVTIPASVTFIGDAAFAFCTTLTNVTIPDSVTSIGDFAFLGCTSLTSVTIGNSVTSIGDEAFAECNGLTSVAIPNSVTSIGDIAFLGCTNLTSITIPKSVTAIGELPFHRCTSLTAITVDALNSAYSSVDGVLFNKNQTTLLQCPQGKSGNYTVPNSISGIGDSAFSLCTSLTSITIGNSVTSIGGYAFEFCTGLTGMVIPNNVTSIGNGAFSYCQSLTGVFFQGNAPSFGLNVFEGDINCTIYYLPGSTGWDSNFGGTTALWSLPYPLILNNGSSFGPQTNRFGFIISWATNIPVVVEASTTLNNPIWSPVGTNTLTGGSSYFSDPAWTNYPSRFYRLRSP